MRSPSTSKPASTASTKQSPTSATGSIASKHDSTRRSTAPPPSSASPSISPIRNSTRASASSNNALSSAAMKRLLLCVALFASTAFADVDPALFGDLHWRLIGPFRGGRVLAVTGVPNEPDHFYFGHVNGGVWESHDAGRTWTPIFDDQPVGSIGALAVAPSDAKTIYAGTGEADMRSDISQGDGVYKSIDGGKTWTHSGLRDSQQIGRIIVRPDDANVVYVAALRHPYGPNAERGVFRSRDGGKTWQRILSRNDSDTGAIDLAF